MIFICIFFFLSSFLFQKALPLNFIITVLKDLKPYACDAAEKHKAVCGTCPQIRVTFFRSLLPAGRHFNCSRLVENGVFG
jgi:hypothetical protein